MFHNPLPLSVSSFPIFNSPTFFLQFNMVCRNLCQRFYSKIVFGKSHYESGNKYCRRCENYYCHNGVFCPCCGMALRMSPTNKRDKERLRQLRPREEEDRIIRIKKGTKYPVKANQSKIPHNHRSNFSNYLSD